jgi:hypothetical protein
MSANVDPRPPPVSNYVYPKFHDVQSSRTTKDIQLDNAICQILAHYLNTDVLDTSSKLSRSLPTAPPLSKHKPSSLPPYWKVRSTRPYQQTHRNWFGETESVPKDILILQQNTLKNSKPQAQNEQDNSHVQRPASKSRSKSVSFNETVTVISQDLLTKSQLKQGSAVDTLDEDEDNFVDAVENFEDFADEN